MRPPGLHRSAGIRLAVVYVALFCISALALVTALWWGTGGLLNRQAEAAIHADAEGLAERWQEAGVTGLRSAIEDRLAENVDDNAIYLLVNTQHQRVAGNLDAWPQGIQEANASYELQIQRAGSRGLARVHRFELNDGYSLLVGRDMQARSALRALLADTLLWALLPVAGLGAAGAMVLQRLFRRMLANVSAISTAISTGDFAQRVRVSGRGDEFDRLAETINDMLDRIARLMDGVRQVSDAIAHDLRTPITRARSRLEDAASHGTSTDELRSAVERAVADLDGITAVFQALLRIAEIETGARRIAFALLDATPLLESLAELYGALAEERGLRLVLQVPPHLPVHGDRELIQQALANLLDNAIKFSPPGGTVRVQASGSATELHLAVTDAGPGIAAADRVRVLERFYRGDRARHTPGFGLGLTLVQAVANLHGGTLQLEDAGPGLRAVLVLPLVA